jgi:hypothetical protein
MHPEIATLSRHLNRNLQNLRGRAKGRPQHFSPALLIPVAVIAGAAVLLSVSPKARKSLLLKVMMVVSTHLLQDKAEDDLGTGTEAYDPSKN